MREEDKMKEQLAEEVRALRDRCAGLEAAIEGVTDAVFVKDSVGRNLAVNAAAASLFGMSAGEVIGRGDTELLPPEAVRQNNETDRTVIAGGTTLTIESTTTHPDCHPANRN
jgi:PAS domain S-box-containing protein